MSIYLLLIMKDFTIEKFTFLIIYLSNRFFGKLIAMKPEKKFSLLTFYKFVDISDPQEQVQMHKQFCDDIGMRGRVYI